MKDYLSITDMADIHNISRQTLIYYDKIGLFKPDYVDENGYRYYSPLQIPFLREICFLKSVGIKLQDIKNHIDNRNLTTAISLLEYHQNFIDNEINDMLKIHKSIQQRLKTYTYADCFQGKLHIPILEEFPERKVVFVPFENQICKQELHITLMKAWNILIKHGILPSEGFGTIFTSNKQENSTFFEGAGIFVYLPFEHSDIKNVITLPAGQYVCMNKYAMPYDTQYLYRLTDWIYSNNYRIIGNIVDVCLLDTTFYENDKSVDFCQLQIPVEKVL